MKRGAFYLALAGCALVGSALGVQWLAYSAMFFLGVACEIIVPEFR